MWKIEILVKDKETAEKILEDVMASDEQGNKFEIIAAATFEEKVDVEESWEINPDGSSNKKEGGNGQN